MQSIKIQTNLLNIQPKMIDFTRLYDKNIDNLFAFGSRFTTDRELLKDCIHDVFVKFYTKREELKYVDNIESYLFISLRNRINDEYRRNAHLCDNEIFENTICLNDDIEDTPDTAYDLTDGDIEKLFDKLSPRQRQIINLYYIEQKKYNDICHPKDEDHCWDGIFMNDIRDAWVRHVNFRHLAGSAVNLQKNTSRITVEDCIASEPISEVGGWRRCVFLTRGQQTLFQRCISRQGIHDFAAGYCAAGPNAFVQCEGEESLGFSGSIGSWASGLLFDIVNIDGNDLRFANLEQFQFGTGWNTANSMFWQCTASTIECYSPDEDNRCSAHGCWGTLTGNGNWTSSNDHVSPRSLFYDQLEKRLSASTIIPDLKKHIHNLSHILPRSTNATSSPTVEQAMELAKESLTTPRLTLEAWIDSIPFMGDINYGKANSLKISKKTNPTNISNHYQFSSHITANDLLLTGNQYDIPWWSGRVKDNFVERDARPAITRFVPGREATGWTDRIDSVVNYLSDHHIWMNYTGSDGNISEAVFVTLHNTKANVSGQPDYGKYNNWEHTIRPKNKSCR